MSDAMIHQGLVKQEHNLKLILYSLIFNLNDLPGILTEPSSSVINIIE